MYVATNTQPPNSVKEMIEWLIRLGRPPLPECPQECAKVGREPKSPHFFDGRRVVPISWKQWQKELPIADIYQSWFQHPKTFIGTLGGWNGKHWLNWIDFDLKHFASAEECDRAIEVWLEQHPIMADAPMFRTPSGGYRFLLAFTKEPENFKANSGFSLLPNGSHHVGELLTKNGSHTLLPPTVGVNGKSYRWERWSEYPPIVDQPEDVGLYRFQKRTDTKPPVTSINKDASKANTTSNSWTNKNWAISYLGSLSSTRADNYDEWLAVGMALNSADEDLLDEWIEWSQTSAKYESGCCERKWESFKSSGVSIGTLAHMAQQDGWKNPFYQQFETQISNVMSRCSQGELKAHLSKIRTDFHAHFLSNDDWENIITRVRATMPQNTEGSSRDHTLTKNKKLSLEEAADQVKAVLQAKHPELKENILLEEVREACGMGSFDWDKKIVKPIKRNLDAERFRLDLLGLLAIDDEVERIRQQALLAPKYQMSSATIDRALQLIKQRTTTPETQCHSLGDFLDLESEALIWRIPQLLPVKETIILAGAPKEGKTLLAVDAAFAVATGESTFLKENVQPGRVLIVSVDESASSTKAKLLKRGFRRCDSKNVEVMTRFDVRQMKTLEERLEAFKPALVIIDSLKRICHSHEINENSAEFADSIYTIKELLTRYGASGILIHHTSKNQDALGVGKLRGSSAIAGAVWGTWQLESIPKPDPNNKKKLIIDPKDPKRILSVFARDAEGQQLRIELDPENHSWINSGGVGDSEEAEQERKTLQVRIIEVLTRNAHKAGLSGREIIELMEMTTEEGRGIYTALTRMVDKRLITCQPAPNDKRYNLYSVPKQSPPDDRGGGGTNGAGGGNSGSPPAQDISTPPPSPPPCVSIVEYSAETYTQHEENLLNKLVNNYSTITQQHLEVTPPVDYSNPIGVSVLEILNNSDAQVGGGGVEMPQLLPESNSVTAITTTIEPQQPVIKVGDTVRLPNGQVGIIELVYPDGELGVAYDGGFGMWKASQLRIVTPDDDGNDDPDGGGSGGSPVAPTPTSGDDGGAAAPAPEQVDSTSNETTETNNDVVEPIPYDPRSAITHLPGKLEVDLSKIDLSYTPTMRVPEWKPKRSLPLYESVSKLYLDLETSGLDPQSDRVLMAGVMDGNGQSHIFTNEDEAYLLTELFQFLRDNQPKMLFGYNVFAFDLNFLIVRCRKHKVSCPFSKAERTKKITASSVHGKPIEFTPVFWRGTSILDAYHQVGITDKGLAIFNSYSLKDVVLTLKLREERRLELSHTQIQEHWCKGELAPIEQYLVFDLEDTKILSDYLFPGVYYQGEIVPDLSIQKLSYESPAAKWERIYESLYPGRPLPTADEKVDYPGASCSCTPGLYQNCAKIDVNSLYPSLQVRYHLISGKDTEHKAVAVTKYLLDHRLELKRKAKETGDTQATHQAHALKIIANSGTGFCGVGGYPYNDMEAATLVTAYGIKVLQLMMGIIQDRGGNLIECDTDGIIFNNVDPQLIHTKINESIPDGISVSLDFRDTDVYVPKLKNYLLFSPDGDVKPVGGFRKRDKSKLQKEFPVEFLKKYLKSPAEAERYYRSMREVIASGDCGTDWFMVRKKIPKGDKALTGAGLGVHGDIVNYYYTKHEPLSKKTGKRLKSTPLAAASGLYWAEHYVEELDKIHGELMTTIIEHKTTI